MPCDRKALTIPVAEGQGMSVAHIPSARGVAVMAIPRRRAVFVMKAAALAATHTTRRHRHKTVDCIAQKTYPGGSQKDAQQGREPGHSTALRSVLGAFAIRISLSSNAYSSTSRPSAQANS